MDAAEAMPPVGAGVVGAGVVGAGVVGAGVVGAGFVGAGVVGAGVVGAGVVGAGLVGVGFVGAGVVGAGVGVPWFQQRPVDGLRQHRYEELFAAVSAEAAPRAVWCVGPAIAAEVPAPIVRTTADRPTKSHRLLDGGAVADEAVLRVLP